MSHHAWAALRPGHRPDPACLQGESPALDTRELPGHSTCQRDRALLSSFEPSLQYVEALSWTPGERGETHKSKCVGSSLSPWEWTDIQTRNQQCGQSFNREGLTKVWSELYHRRLHRGGNI